jgi:hypothetical protein
MLVARPANGRPRDQRAPRVPSQRSPDCPVCHGTRGCNGRLRQTRKGIAHCSLSGGAPDCPVRTRTEGNQSLSNGAPTTPRSLGAIKGTPRRMEQNSKHPLNILRHRDTAITLELRQFEIRASLWVVIRCVVSCASLSSCERVLLWFVSCVCFYSPLLLSSFDIKLCKAWETPNCGDFSQRDKLR